jgi:hypothetical protein
MVQYFQLVFQLATTRRVNDKLLLNILLLCAVQRSTSYPVWHLVYESIL